MKIKKALCVSRNIAETVRDINAWPVELIDRNICETDKETLQIISYVILQDFNTGKFFSYCRGKVGNEGRLHSKLSIGIGGHIDTYIHSLTETICLEASREIEEETGILADTIYGQIKEIIEEKNYSKINLFDSPNPVDHVHLGFAFILQINASDMTKLEDGVIINPHWYSEDELIAIYNDSELDPDDMELWTARCIHLIASEEL